MSFLQRHTPAVQAPSFLAPPGQNGAQPPASAWETWPFSFGNEESWLFLATKGLFILAIFVVLVLFVRWLFGPGGRLAEPWMREEWQARQQADLADLEERYRRGELTEDAYRRRRRKLERPV